jgi:hypothetical protein
MIHRAVPAGYSRLAANNVASASTGSRRKAIHPTSASLNDGRFMVTLTIQEESPPDYG